MAMHNPGINVTVIDNQSDLLRAWNSSSLPVAEPGLQEIVFAIRHNVSISGKAGQSGDCKQRSRGTLDTTTRPVSEETLPASPSENHQGNLFFDHDSEKSIRQAGMIFLCVSTPTKVRSTTAKKCARDDPQAKTIYRMTG
jgi:UDPglucose 6-dehydrogenase